MANIPYQIRYSKHIERKIFLELLNHLRDAGYPISSYSYKGFGSIFYTDFILFNTYLCIDKMTCYERDLDKTKRMKFNKPFSCIDLKMGNFSSYASDIEVDTEYLIWLDYEEGLADSEDILNDLGILVSNLKRKSILIVTINAHAKPSDERKDVLQDCENNFGHLVNPIELSDLAHKKFPLLYSKALRAQIDNAMISRPDDEFIQLVNFKYDDGASMLTIGGIIEEKSQQKKDAIDSALSTLFYINQGEKPTEITVPFLTAREKIWLDSSKSKVLDEGEPLPFELKLSEIQNYYKFSRHYPHFHEVII